MELSIITINLNNYLGLITTLESIENQTFDAFEYIIIDGNSTDGSLELLQQDSNKITYWLSEKDTGIYNAMNKGIRMAKGDYLLFLNSGDSLFETTTLSKVFERPRTSDFLTGNMNIVTNKGSSIRKASKENEYSLSYFFTNSLPHPSTFIARRLFSDSLYDESYKISADKKFFIQKLILENCSIESLPFTISNFNLEGISSNPENARIIIEENNRIFFELFPQRIYPELINIKENYHDINSLLRIKQNKLAYCLFKFLKKYTTVLGKF